MKQSALPDVAISQLTDHSKAYQLNNVGMSNVELPIQIESDEGLLTIPARAEATVNLNTSAKGIHMSRLYRDLMVKLSSQPLTLELVAAVTRDFLDSHKSLSNKASLKLDFELSLKKKSLLSDLNGWRHYPVTIHMENQAGSIQCQVEVILTYSSTCPCSAALSRQIIQQKFKQTFSNKEMVNFEAVNDWLMQEESLAATPHSQRSNAIVQVGIQDANSADPSFFQQICEQLESILPTPVQTMVKREDEQEFARLNAENLMFCEDAARRFKVYLESKAAKQQFSNYYVRIEHLESLHAHDAIAEIYSE